MGLILLNPLLGAAAGAGAGALSGALSDIGIEDGFMKQVGASLENGGAAVFVLVRKVTGDKVLAALEAFRAKGKVVQTSLSGAQEEKLKALIEGAAKA